MPEQSKKPRKIYYDSRSVTLRTKQTIYFVQEHDKAAMLELILKERAEKQSVILTRSKLRADELSAYLQTKEIKASAIHSNRRVSEQEEIANAFKSGELKIIITTDKILEALALTNIEFVVSYDLPIESETYFARVASLKELGDAVALVSPEDDRLLSTIELALKQELPQEELAGFTPTPFVPKKTSIRLNPEKKKPRNKKKKAKKTPQKES